MKKTKFVIDRLAKVVEQGIVNYKDISEDILSVLKSKRDEIVFKMKLTDKGEFEILRKRVENLEIKLDKLRNQKKKKTKLAKKS